jgi:hypothetical protein
VTTYRTGNHWGVTIVREGERTPEGHITGPAQLVAVVVNGDQALAERICALLNDDDRCWHGEHCPGSGPECERDGPLKGGHRDCAAAWHGEHGCYTEPYDVNAPSARTILPSGADEASGVVGSGSDGPKAAEERSGDPMAGNRCGFCLIPSPAGSAPTHRLGCPTLATAKPVRPRCICNDPPPTVDKPKNGTPSRPDGWACPRHGTVI